MGTPTKKMTKQIEITRKSRIPIGSHRFSRRIAILPVIAGEEKRRGYTWTIKKLAQTAGAGIEPTPG
jgi:hypothetical protein